MGQKGSGEVEEQGMFGVVKCSTLGPIESGNVNITLFSCLSQIEVSISLPLATAPHPP